MTTPRTFAIVAGVFTVLVTRSVFGTPHTFPVMPFDPTLEIAWGDCPESWVGQPSDLLAGRVQCGTMRAPVDHVAPDERRFDVGVIRVSAAVPAQREGAIFFNKGGPGSHPGKLLMSLARSWTLIQSDDPDEVNKRRLAERYDLVAVIPRGLTGSGDFRCVTGMPARYAFLPTNLDDDNWRLVLEEAQSVVDACGAVAHARYINTEQHVHDMDMLRRALGDERLHFYGISYGGMVGAWYASIYPEHTGRMLLDSSLDFTGDYRTAIRAAMDARHREFFDKAVTPLLRETARYGLGTDKEAVVTAIDALPARIRKVRARIQSPLELAAALHVGALLRTDDPSTLEAMTRLLQRPLTGNDALLDGRIRRSALWFASAIYASPQVPEFSSTHQGDSVRAVVPCNDMQWTRSEQAIRRTAVQDAARYYSATGGETFEELVCTRWGGRSARAPVLSTMGRVPPFLLVQSDQDTSTPLAGAARILDRFANGRLLLVRQSSLHGVFNFNTSSCIETTASHYLLTGVFPDSPSRVLACDGAFDNPVDALPGSPAPPASEPAPVAAPVPPRHDEF
ncbi:alpha/beta fold hydrolase [Luteibacter sp.]|jgi:pimeloyl-ACP methyl ester carboxylesterase|uniref:alpha/beta fold hydrolase n=1 Tax=Luteibacter sp. TaxID=1886636 RepID=UPI002F3F13ED